MNEQETHRFDSDILQLMNIDPECVNANRDAAEIESNDIMAFEDNEVECSNQWQRSESDDENLEEVFNQPEQNQDTVEGDSHELVNDRIAAEVQDSDQDKQSDNVGRMDEDETEQQLRDISIEVQNQLE